jgi:hypothetical protein
LPFIGLDVGESLPVLRIYETGAANTGTISATTGQKQAYCSDQANKAFIEEVLPGGHVLLGGDYRPITVVGSTAEVVRDHVISTAATSTSFLYTIRSWTGVPMSVTSKFLTGVGYLFTARTLYNATKAMQREYKACME